MFRGGIGLFMDTFPGQIADGLSENTPVDNIFPFTISGNLAPTQQTGGNVFNSAAVTNAAINSGFSQGLNAAQIQANAAAKGGQFAPPGFTNVNTIQAPRYWEWNFEVQQAVGNNTSITVNYVGNHGFHETAIFDNQNAFCPASSCPSGFIGLPASAPDSSFSGVNQIQTLAVSNYNGLTVTAQHRFSHGLQIQANYTFSHALDEISNGGFNQFIAGNANSGRLGSFQNPISNTNIRQYNYGNADYDTRHYLSANYVYELPKFFPVSTLKGKVADGWSIQGITVLQSGQPYSIIDYTGAVGSIYFSVFDGITNPVVPLAPGCTAKNAVTGSVGAFGNGDAALKASCFTLPLLQPGDLNGAIPANDTFETNFTNGQRNIFRQSWQRRADISFVKLTQLSERYSLKYTFDIFNLTNTTSFDIPIDDVSQNQFYNNFPVEGQPLYNPPSGLGIVNKAIGSPRQIQMTLHLAF